MTLYHYTTPAGLSGILNEKTFWASDCRFLNDSSEFQYGKKIVAREISRYQADIESAGVEAWPMLSSFLNNIDNENTVAFVASFTTRGDLLSQWRGYNNGRGYALGINEDWLNQNAINQGFDLFPVVYDKPTQQKSAEAAVRLLITLLDEANNDPTRTHDIVKIWWKRALRIALALKDEHFSEENEYRLAYIGNGWPSCIKTRQGTSGMIPYVPCKFNCFIINNPLFHPNNLGLERIIIGPALAEHQVAAVDALLASHHMRFQISRSEIPYVAS